ncbi:hypothetical protein [Plantibacter sp. YIM 135249]|uniref:hypothetical protein n=1 Tax=Plantibacter sp. YIM 135249 TaxID=3423918 RepID=UPI003D351DF1
MSVGTATTVLVWVSAAVFVACVVFCVMRARNRAWVVETHLALRAQPFTNLLLAAFLLLCAGLVGVFGIGFIGRGTLLGWALLFAAAGKLVLVGFFVWVATRPFNP